MVRRKTTIGDVFIVPLGDGRAGVGQVVADYGASAHYFAIFDDVMSVEMAPMHAVEATTSPVALLALSMDAKIHVGDWVTVGHAPVADGMPLPAYKELVGVPDQFDVFDFSGNRRRPATPEEVSRLPNRKVVAPVRIENALKALLGLGPWLPIFDELRPQGRVTTADVFG